MSLEGILPLCKPKGKTSFHMVSLFRKITTVRKIGHAGTLDPFATGVLILLIGKSFTTLSDRFLTQDKAYLATVRLGSATTTYDPEGEVTKTSAHIPTKEAIEQALPSFQGTILQTPPMFSAKKVAGKKLYELARKGISIERKAVPVTLHTTLVSYNYPDLILHIECSKGTYIRSVASDLGELLGCYAHLTELVRTRSGRITLENCCDPMQCLDPSYNWQKYLCTLPPL
ncbi:MAG: tRNA pseudouridine synthase [Chlamydiota bacterium]|jgi:tRNA pseudouridine55 synthase